MPRDLSDYQSKLFKDEEDRETRYMNPDGRFVLKGKSGLGTAREISSSSLYTGRGSDNIGSLHRKFYTDFAGQKRKDILHEFDINSLVVRRTKIQAQMNIPKASSPEEKDYGMFSEGDFGPGKRKTSMGAAIKVAALTAAAGLYIYRGLKGAGWFPGGRDFWKPLAKIQEQNIVSTFYRTKVPWSVASNKWNINLAKEMQRGVGLSTIPEGIGRLMGRSIEGIPEALSYLGFPNAGKAAKWIPRKILGGSISGGLGLNRASAGYQKRVFESLVQTGVKPIIPSAPKILGRLALFGGAVYGGMLAFNYLDYRVRRSEALDKTPLREGVTGMAATAWVNSRMGIQKLLKKARITDLHNYLEDLMPGYLRVAGMVAGAVLGVKAGIKPPEKMIARYGAKEAQAMFLKRGSTYLRAAMSALPRTLAFGAAGYAAERALGYEPEQLEKIYSGEEKVPVKSGRWWEFGRCCLPSTLVRNNLTSLKRADEIKIGDTVLSVNGKLSVVKDVIKRDVEDHEFCISITTSLNRAIPAEVTNNHPLLVLRRPGRGWFSGEEKRELEFDWEEAGTLNIGDYLAFPIPILEKEEESILGVKADKDLGFLLGHFLAEGNLNKRNGKAGGVEFCCSLDELEYLEKDREVIRNIFGKEFNITKRESCGVYRLRPRGKDISEFFESLFYRNGDKEVPESFFNLPDEFLDGFLNGYYCGDGHAEGNNKCITSKRLQLLIFFQLYLLSVGQTSTIVKHSAGEYPAFRLIISSDKNGRDLFIRDGLVFSKITEISDVEYSGEVIDFEIEDSHSFCAAGFVLHNTPWEGGKTKYYRQHWYPLMMSRYREKDGLYPSEDWKWKHHWLVGPLTTGKIPDPYAWEKEYAEKRPYPITTGAFEDVPIIGPALQATLGRFIKPRKLMHTEAWMDSGGGIVQQPDTSERVRRVPVDASERLGMKGMPRGGMGEVISPQNIKNLLGEQQYRLTEWFGLPGFVMQETHKAVIGKESAFETARLESPERATGFERGYWDRELGGLVGTTEIFRRFFPHRRRQVQNYNPIPNLMGKEQPWLPGPEYFIDFKHGDPFTKVPMGEARLPGKSYEALNEFHSSIPGVYDAMDRFLILADVAPYSDQFKHYRAIVNMWQKGGVLDEKWTGKKAEALRQRKDVMQRYNFTPRRFGRIKEIVEEALTEENTQKKEGRDYNAIERALGGAWETITHTAANVPVPGVSWMTSKLLAHRTPIEHYERYQAFGRESAFWNQPVRDFAAVYGKEIAGKIAPNIIPKDVQKRRELEEYFDRLKYVKYRQLESLSDEKGDQNLAKAFHKKQQETMFGVNPYGSWGTLFRAMPRRERDYFQEFRKADVKERGRIRQIVSRDMARLYEAQWNMEDTRAGRKSDTKRVERNIDADLSEFFKDKHLPGPNWIGWHPDINLNKVKLKVVKNEGQDIHDFNLWESQEREMRGEPIPNIENYSSPNPQYDSPELRKLLLETLLNRGVKSPNIEITTQPSNNPSVNMDFDLGLDQSDRYYKSVGRRAYMMA